MNYSPKQGTRSHGLPHDPLKAVPFLDQLDGFQQYQRMVKII